MRLAKNGFGSVLQKNCGFRFGFTKLTAVSVFGSVFCCVLFNVYDARNDVTYFRAELVQLIVSRSDSELKVQRYDMKKNTVTVDPVSTAR